MNTVARKEYLNRMTCVMGGGRYPEHMLHVVARGYTYSQSFSHLLGLMPLFFS
jgi:hypothetical protein